MTDIHKRLQKLNSEISDEINRLASEFKNDTGFTVTDVYLTSFDVTTVDDAGKQYLFQASCNLDIFEVDND